MRRYNKYSISRCYCPTCGNYMTVPRIEGRSRERNHKKDLWCPICKEVKTMKERRASEFMTNGLGELLY